MPTIYHIGMAIKMPEGKFLLKRDRSRFPLQVLASGVQAGLIFSRAATGLRADGVEADSLDALSRITDGALPQFGLCRLMAILTQLPHYRTALLEPVPVSIRFAKFSVTKPIVTLANSKIS